MINPNIVLAVVAIEAAWPTWTEYHHDGQNEAEEWTHIGASPKEVAETLADAGLLRTTEDDANKAIADRVRSVRSGGNETTRPPSGRNIRYPDDLLDWLLEEGGEA